jgi:hypothetical protein
MKRNDHVHLKRVPGFAHDAWGVILNDRCTAGFVVVGYDSDDVQFRVKVRCELVDVISAPKFKVGDEVMMVDKTKFAADHVFTINNVRLDADMKWRYAGRDGIYSIGGQHEEDIMFTEPETA